MGRFANILAEAAEKTNRELDTEISSLTRLRAQDLKRLAPTKSDKQKLLRLLEIVNQATSENRKILKLKSNIDDLAGIVIRSIRLLA